VSGCVLTGPSREKLRGLHLGRNVRMDKQGIYNIFSKQTIIENIMVRSNPINDDDLPSSERIAVKPRFKRVMKTMRKI